jgi:hypothetical protein
MNPIVEAREINFILRTQETQPILANPKMLEYSGVVPGEWKLVQTPIKADNLLSLEFENKMGIVVQPHSIAFQEIIKDKSIDTIQIPDVTSKYVMAMPNLGYQQMFTKIIGHVPYIGKPLAPVKYINQTLLTSGEWMEFGKAEVESAIIFRYRLETSILHLTVNQGTYRTGDEEIIPIVAFFAEFHHDISAETTAEIQQKILQAIESWQINFKIYTDLINQKFLTPYKNQKETHGFSFN